MWNILAYNYNNQSFFRANCGVQFENVLNLIGNNE